MKKILMLAALTIVLGLFPASSRAQVANDDGPRQVPEPSTLLLLGSGLIGVSVYLRRK